MCSRIRIVALLGCLLPASMAAAASGPTTQTALASPAMQAGRGQSTQLAASQPAQSQAAGRYDPDELILCSGRQVAAIRLDRDGSQAEPTWTWTAADCPQIPVQHRGWFRAMDDCKPVLGGTHVLATSSGDGVVLIDRADGSGAFYAQSVNAHSAELVRDRWIAVASSVRGNQLQIFDRHDARRPAEAVAAIPLPGAHGVVYDWRGDVLWALGTDELLQTRLHERKQGAEVQIEVIERYPLPARGGHDLFPYFHYGHEKGGAMPDTAGALFVTVWDSVYVFDLRTRKFEPFEPLAGQGNVKSITDHLATGRIVYQRGDEDSNFSRTIRFLNPPGTHQLGEAIGTYKTQVYRVRWNQPNPLSYRQDAAPGPRERFSIKPQVEIRVGVAARD